MNPLANNGKFILEIPGRKSVVKCNDESYATTICHFVTLDNSSLPQALDNCLICPIS